MVQRRDLAEDCVQESFIRAFNRIHELRKPAAFGSWLLNIAYRIALDVIRKETRDHRLYGLLDHEVPTTAEPDVLLRTRLMACIERLDDIYREVLVLYELLGLTHPEIADFLGIPEGSSKRRLFEARRRLRALLEPTGYNL
jgi:RNA polymerase sigma factor (sigma-70 family)